MDVVVMFPSKTSHVLRSGSTLSRLNLLTNAKLDADWHRASSDLQVLAGRDPAIAKAVALGVRRLVARELRRTDEEQTCDNGTE